jgi:hypothetical protein
VRDAISRVQRAMNWRTPLVSTDTVMMKDMG